MTVSKVRVEDPTYDGVIYSNHFVWLRVSSTGKWMRGDKCDAAGHKTGKLDGPVFIWRQKGVIIPWVVSFCDGETVVLSGPDGNRDPKQVLPKNWEQKGTLFRVVQDHAIASYTTLQLNEGLNGTQEWAEHEAHLLEHAPKADSQSSQTKFDEVRRVMARGPYDEVRQVIHRQPISTWDKTYDAIVYNPERTTVWLRLRALGQWFRYDVTDTEDFEGREHIWLLSIASAPVRLTERLVSSGNFYSHSVTIPTLAECLELERHLENGLATSGFLGFRLDWEGDQKMADESKEASLPLRLETPSAAYDAVVRVDTDDIYLRIRTSSAAEAAGTTFQGWRHAQKAIKGNMVGLHLWQSHWHKLPVVVCLFPDGTHKVIDDLTGYFPELPVAWPATGSIFRFDDVIIPTNSSGAANLDRMLNAPGTGFTCELDFVPVPVQLSEEEANWKKAEEWWDRKLGDNLSASNAALQNTEGKEDSMTNNIIGDIFKGAGSTVGLDITVKFITRKLARAYAAAGRPELAETLLSDEARGYVAALMPATLLGLAVVASKSTNEGVRTTAESLTPVLVALTASSCGSIASTLIQEHLLDENDEVKAIRELIANQRELAAGTKQPMPSAVRAM